MGWLFVLNYTFNVNRQVEKSLEGQFISKINENEYQILNVLNFLLIALNLRDMGLYGVNEEVLR